MATYSCSGSTCNEPRGHVIGRHAADTRGRFGPGPRIRGFVTALMMAIASACAGSTEPSRSITFDVTTSFTEFSFETPAPSPPDCPNYTLYCTHVRPFTGATLSGTLMLDETARVGGSVTAQLAGTFCNAWSVSPTGCTSVKDSPLHEYHEDSFRTPHPTTGEVVLQQGDFFSTAVLLTYDSPLETSDTVRGTIRFMEYQYRDPPTHIGTYLAVRRRGP
jgi:hypothetical protein